MRLEQLSFYVTAATLLLAHDKPVTIGEGAEPIPLIELTVVAPTFNERCNIGPLIDRLKVALAGVRWQLMVVDDDSRDGTADLVKGFAGADVRVQCIRRIGRRGLSGAVVEGALASAARFVAVIDADLQHDETLLPQMLGLLRNGDADLVIASRYLAKGSSSAGFSRWRSWVSRISIHLARRALKMDVTDPSSGFFMVRRVVIDDLAPRLSPTGFKILFDIIASAKGALRIKEIPYVFTARAEGESKFNSKVAMDYLGLVLSKLTRDWVSPRAFMFGLVGASGVAVHLTILRAALGLGVSFTEAQGLGALVAVTSNYFINNGLTYRDRRQSGWRMAGGYARFCILCALGLIANIAVATLVRERLGGWGVAGVAGAGVGAAWNYLTTAVAVW